jgi:hypothetical protein
LHSKVLQLEFGMTINHCSEIIIRFVSKIRLNFVLDLTSTRNSDESHHKEKNLENYIAEIDKKFDKIFFHILSRFCQFKFETWFFTSEIQSNMCQGDTSVKVHINVSGGGNSSLHKVQEVLARSQVAIY